MHAARRGMRAAAEGLPRRRSLWHKTASPALRRARNRLRAAAQVVAATNIAETSVTIPGITYVIDSCFVKARARAPRLLLPVERAGARPHTRRPSASRLRPLQRCCVRVEAPCHCRAAGSSRSPVPARLRLPAP